MTDSGKRKSRQPNKAMIQEYKKILHGSGPVQAMLKSEKVGLKPTVVTLYGTLSEIGPKIARLNQMGCAAYMLVNASDGNGRKTENITKVTALFIDMDKRGWLNLTVKEILAQFPVPVPPHMIVNTSPGNYHAYWLIDDIELTDFSNHQKRLAEMFGTDPTVCDLPRVMRVAGTINHKDPDHLFLAKPVHIAEDQTPYKIKYFVAEMFAAQAGIVAPVTAPIAVPRSSASEVPFCQFDDELQQLRNVLFSIPSDNRQDWSKVGMALKATYSESGYPLFVEWSQTSSKFNVAETKRQWDSFSSSSAGGITISSVYYLANQYGPKADNSNAITLFDFATQFVTASLGGIKYDTSQKVWFAYANGLWMSNEAYSDGVAHSFIRKLSKPPTSSSIALRLTNNSGIKELLRLASVDTRCHIRSEEFDANPNIIGVNYQNAATGLKMVGVIDLQNGTVRDATPQDRITKVLGASYDSNATCPRFIRFIDEITDGDIELAGTFQMILGYTLSGLTKAQLMFVLIGEGENGKGVLMRLINRIFGPYCREITNSLIRQHTTNPNAASPAVAALVGARIIICSEFPKDTSMDETFVKSLTGSDPITCRGNYANQMTFIPQGKLFLHTNCFPRINFKDESLWRRIYPIYFTRQFSKDNRDDHLEDNLLGELSGILNWLIQGAVRYYAEGKILYAESSSRYLEKVKGETDTIASWVKDCCVVGKTNCMPSSSAYLSYKEHARNNNARPVGTSEFKKILEAKGYRGKRTNKANIFEGFRLKAIS